MKQDPWMKCERSAGRARPPPVQTPRGAKETLQAATDVN